MPSIPSRALALSQALIRLLRMLNIAFAIALLVAIPASFVFDAQFHAFFGTRPARLDPSWLLPLLRTWLVLALAMAAAVHLLLERLRAMVESVRAGDPFVPANALRLKTIAWCMLGLQVLNVVFGLLASTINAAGSDVHFSWSVAGWLVVALLFVLSWVFEEGTRMRGDLEAMV